jgi:hypothetical protein
MVFFLHQDMHFNEEAPVFEASQIPPNTYRGTNQTKGKIRSEENVAPEYPKWGTESYLLYLPKKANPLLDEV